MSHFLQCIDSSTNSIDVESHTNEKNAKANITQTSTENENEDLSQVWKILRTDLGIENHQFIDSFRHLHPDRKEAFTCWNTEMKCRENNYGTRIDYILSDLHLLPYITHCDIQPEIMGSDHCPVRAVYECISGSTPDSKPPSFCTKHFPEFAGNQQKLSAYFTSKAPNEKRKLDENILDFNQAKKKKVSTQSSISSFFNKTKTSINISNNVDHKFVENSINSEIPSSHNTKVNYENYIIQNEEKRLKAATAWKAMMKGPPPAPNCKGHNEVCVLRTVKKKGPNLGRQFWCCARGEGRANDPNARCDFFKWIK